MLVARGDQQRAVEIVRLLGDRFARRLRGGMIAEEGEKLAADFRAQAAPPQLQHRARPFGIALRQQRQIEQPFAGIVDDLELERGGLAEIMPSRCASKPVGTKRMSTPISLMSAVAFGQPAGVAAIASILAR